MASIRKAKRIATMVGRESAKMSVASEDAAESAISRRDILRLSQSFAVSGLPMIGMTLGITGAISPLPATGGTIGFQMAVSMKPDIVTLSLHDVVFVDVGSDFRLTVLQLDGQSILNQLSNATNSNLVVATNPGRVIGNGAVVSELQEPLEEGALYLVSYDVIEDHQPETGIFFGAGSPFQAQGLPRGPGSHSILVHCVDAAAQTLLRITGDVTFGMVSCQRAEWTFPLPPNLDGQALTWEVECGGSVNQGTVYVPEPGVYYVAPNGSDLTGTGALGSPFRQPQRASEVSQPGDTIYLRPGLYAPFEVQHSGATGHPITFNTLAGEERQAIIEGDLLTHKFYGGAGAVPRAKAVRGGVEIRAKDHIHIRNLTFRNLPFDGVYIQGDESAENIALPTPQRHGNHVVAGCLIRNVGNSAIWGCGYFVDKRLAPGLILTEGLLFENNDVSETNVVTDYNNNPSNPQGVPGGVNEAISVAGGVANAVTRFNDIHDSRQYGVDYKADVYGGEIYGNRIWNIERYGIYIDAGRRTVQDVDVYGNEIWDCDAGIVLAREADFNLADPVTDFVQTLKRINVYNNLIWDVWTVGLYCQGHPGDAPLGEITDVRINFNTVMNAARDGSGREARLSEWADPDWLAANVVSGFEFVGNILWRSDGPTGFLDEFSGNDQFTVADNLVGIDPLFVEPGASPPDLRLQAGSAAHLQVSSVYIVTPFDVTNLGTDRSVSRTAGAM